ncbi:MAG: hypothetical protein SFU85_07970 [Candidatus Methylacidiphilales bacterium]|nr:hypothetical protein [Candidatus Methylacidiphilales bacterium]
MNETAHRHLVRERQQRSEFWRAIHALGSLKLAVFLLLTVALACAAATFAESKFNIKVAKYYIYDNPWFSLWLALLVVNLACAALTRWPWQAKHTGFVVTHAGIILMLAGAVIGRHFGYEGTTTLKKGGEPTGMLVVDETVFLVESPGSGLMYEAPLPVVVRVPRPDRPRTMPVPDSDLAVEVRDYSENLSVRAVVEADPSGTGPAGIELEMATAMMNQTLHIPLALAPVETRSYDLFGRARIEWVEKLPAVARPAAKAAKEFRETHMVFARMPDQPVWHNTLGKATGFQFRLEVGATGEGRVLIVHPGGRSETKPLGEILDRPFNDPESGFRIHLAQYWANLRMVDGKPVSDGDRPDNPAMLVTLTGKWEEDRGGSPVMRMAPVEGGMVAYQILRGSKLTGQGRVRPGDSFFTGWADWKATLKTFHPHARIRTVAEPVPASGMGTAKGVPGIEAALVHANGSKGTAVWIPSGTSKVLENGDQAVRVGFGLKTRRLDFTVSLEDFTVPRDEGTDTPSNFISDVRFDGLASPQPVRARVEMNTPASYPPGWWGALTGWNHKFSQAGWDPDQLDTTTLQVLHDPGWSLKWIGSLLICGGIFAMFYLKPRNPRTPPTNASAPESTTSP